MDYLAAYKRICSRGIALAVERRASGVYCEKHHVIPRSWGGSNNKDNIAVLTGREHFIAHKLLAKAYPSDRKMKLAAYQMSIDRRDRGYRVRSFDYERMRKEFAKSQAGDANHAKKTEVRQKISAANAGKSSPKKGIPMSAESRAKMSAAKKLLFGERHPRYGAKLTDETKAKISKSNKGKTAGELHPQYGKTRPDHVKAAISAKLKGRKMSAPSANIGTRPWATPRARSNNEIVLAWKNANIVFATWKLQEIESGEALRREFGPTIGRRTFDNMIRHFKNGWIPDEDTEWLGFANNPSGRSNQCPS